MPFAIKLEDVTFYVARVCAIACQLMITYRVLARALENVNWSNVFSAIFRYLLFPIDISLRLKGYFYKNASSDLSYTDFLVVSVFFAMYFMYSCIQSRKIRNRKRKPPILQMLDVLFEVHIRSIFTHQNAELYSCLRNGIKCALREEYTRRPAVILLLHTEEATSTAHSIATRLLRICLAALNNHKEPEYVEEHLTLDGMNYSEVSDFWSFYSQLKERMLKEKMVVIRNFQAIHPHAVTLICPFAHELFTPYKQALLVLLLEMSSYEAGHTECTTRLAEMCLEHRFIHTLDDASWEDLLRATTFRPAVVYLENLLPNDK